MKFLEKYQWLNSCTGVELHILPDGAYDWRVCSVSLAGNSLNIDSKTEVPGDTAAVLKKFPKDKPLALTITGKGVLIRKAPAMEEIGENQLNQVFPNLEADQFYIQNFISGGQSFVSIIRREIIDGLMDVLSAEGLNILLLTIGPFTASHILKQLNTYGQEICFDGHEVQYNKEWEWTEYRYAAGKKSEFPLKIDLESIPEQYLLAYAAAFQLALYPRLAAVSLPVGQAENNLYEFQQKQQFQFRAGCILAVFFVVLLLNFLLFSYYNSANEALLSQVSQSSAGIESLRNTEKEIASNEKLLKELGWSRGVRYAWIADQLGQTVPAGLSLREIAINPLNTVETGRQRREVYDTGKIKIRGEASDPGAVNNWLYLLKGKSWVKGVNLDSFSPSSSSGDNKQEFSITISY